jgi:hypothetical protein
VEPEWVEQSERRPKQPKRAKLARASDDDQVKRNSCTTQAFCSYRNPRLLIKQSNMSRFWAANESSEDDSSSDDSSVSSSSSEDNKKGAGGNNKWLEFSDDSGKSFSLLL